MTARAVRQGISQAAFLCPWGVSEFEHGIIDHVACAAGGQNYIFCCTSASYSIGSSVMVAGSRTSWVALAVELVATFCLLPGLCDQEMSVGILVPGFTAFSSSHHQASRHC